MPTTRPLPSRAADALRRDLRPAAGRGAEIDDALARLQQAVLVVDLEELVGGARAVALALGAGDVGVVELALEPALRGRAVRLRAVFSRCFERARARAALCRSPARRRAPPDAVLAHQVHQDALAQAAVGDAQAVGREGAPDRLEDGAAGEHEIGAVAADAGVRGALGRSGVSMRSSMTAVTSPSRIHMPSTRRRS